MLWNDNLEAFDNETNEQKEAEDFSVPFDDYNGEGAIFYKSDNDSVDECLEAFKELVKETSLVEGCCVAVADHVGDIVYQRGLDRISGKVQGIIPCIEEKSRKRAIINMSKGKPEIYPCSHDRKEYMAVHKYVSSITKCATVYLGEGNSESLEEYSVRLQAAKDYLTKFAARTKMKNPHHPVIKKFESKLCGVNEIIQTIANSQNESGSSTVGIKAEKYEENAFVDVQALIDKLLLFTGGYDGVKIKHQGDILAMGSCYTFMPMLFVKIMLYIMGFLLYNSENKALNLKIKKYEGKVRAVFSTDLNMQEGGKMYYKELSKNLSHHKIKMSFTEKDGKIYFRTVFPLYPESINITNEAQGSDVIIDEILSRDETLHGFGIFYSNDSDI